jgi:hypothetical protein
MRWEKTAVYHIEIMHVVGATVQIQHRSRWVFSKPTGAALMSHNRRRHITARMGCAVKYIGLRLLNAFQYINPTIYQAIVRFYIIRRVINSQFVSHKAVRLHRFQLEKTDDGWTARVILDI